jgi:tripartite-type tricarboxylate transporter receptor subunit TctC
MMTMSLETLWHKRFITTASIGLLLLPTTSAIGQGQYPDRSIRIIVPFAAGGAVDVMARIIGEKLASTWGQPVIVENRVGASGNVGAEVVARAEPDGYTLLISPPPPLAINQHLFSNLRFDPAAFVPITIIAGAPNVLLARPGLAASNVPELIALAKSQPGKLTYGSAGRGSTPHLSAEMLKSLGGIEMAHVTYKSVPQAINDVVGGSIDLTFGTLVDSIGLIQSGQLKALGIGGVARTSSLANVPSVAETFPGYLSMTWYAVVAPPNTSSQIVEKLSVTIAKVLKESGAMAKLESLQSTPILNSPLEASTFIATDSERWRKVIAAAGLMPE